MATGVNHVNAPGRGHSHRAAGGPPGMGGLYGVQVEAVTLTDAEWAARRWAPGEGLSLADRLCMALGDRLDADIWTADQAWGTGGRIQRVG